MNDPVILKASGLTKSYPRRDGGVLTILDHVTFAIEAGATVAIVGRSGSGKTTLISLFAVSTDPPDGRRRVEIERPHSVPPARERGNAVCRLPRGV